MNPKTEHKIPKRYRRIEQLLHYRDGYAYLYDHYHNTDYLLLYLRCVDKLFDIGLIYSREIHEKT